MYIGNYVRIDETALIKVGLTIGIDEVIDIGSLVTKSIEYNSITAGNIDKLIKIKLDQEIVLMLLKSKCWECPESFLNKYGALFYHSNSFLNALKGGVN